MRLHTPTQTNGIQIKSSGGFGRAGKLNNKGSNRILKVAAAPLLSQVHNKSVADVLEEVCTLLPLIAQPPCEELISEYGPAVTRLIGNKPVSRCEGLTVLYNSDDEETPDVVCQQISFCENKTCALFPRDLAKHDPAVKRPTCPKEAEPKRKGTSVVDKLLAIEKARRTEELKRIASHTKDSPFERLDVEFDPWQWLVQLISKAVNSHEPIFDFDGDLFSSASFPWVQTE